VAITTTAGTGTEADPWAVITKEDTNEKIGFGNQFTFPVLSVVDPELMLTVPEKLTAYQGFDALFHSTEGYIANIATPISDILALKSIELIAKYLPVCVKDGSNLEARTQVALANTLAGMVESTSSCTSEHSMEHAMSAFHHDLPHGAGLIMLSEAYYTFFSAKIPERLADMARAMGVDTDSLPEGKRAQAFVKALTDLQKACGVYDIKMSDYGIRREEIPALAENSRSTMGGLFTMDRYRLSLEETVEIMKNAYK
jgi:alcohol dehydrogenase